MSLSLSLTLIKDGLSLSDLDDRDEYRKVKDVLAKKIIDILEDKIGDIKENVDVIDVAESKKKQDDYCSLFD